MFRTALTTQRKEGLGAGAAVARVTSILAIPYGFTVTIWSSGALAVIRLGSPSVADVVLFVGGAAAAFVALAVLNRRHLDVEVPMRVPAAIVVNLFPILVALIVALVPVAPLGRHAGYLTIGLLATASYVLSLAFFIRALTQHACKSETPTEEVKGE